MSDTVIKFEDVSKYYRLGVIGTTTIRDDFRRVVARLRGQPDPTLQLDAVDYGNQDDQFIWALRDINLEVKQGEVLGIIGANGAGKSTLLKLLSRVTGPTSGQIKVKGRIGSLLEVGTGFHHELTGRENVYLNGAILGMTRQEITRKFDEIVDFSGVEKHIDTPVKRYSSGMRVRLGFAVAAHLDPEILVVDEVLAVGDASFQKKALGKMDSVSKEGRTVLFVSHNMGSIQQLCQRGLVLKEGYIFLDGAVQDAVAGYVNMARYTPQQFTVTTDKFIIHDLKLLPRTKSNWVVSPLSFNLDIDLFDHTQNLNIRLGINNAYNSRSLTSWNTIPELAKGRNQIMLNIDDHHLLPGNYSVMLSIKHNMGRYRYDNCIHFELDAEGITDQSLVNAGAMGTYQPLNFYVETA